MKKQIKKLALGLVLAASFLGASQANAAVVSVNFDLINNGGGSWGLGSFSGEDNNSDGFLKFDELTAFSWVNLGYDANLGNLNGFGDYSIASNTWFSNGISWIGNPDIAFFTFDNRNLSATSLFFTTQTSAAITQTPIPAAVWLFGSALAGLMGIGKRRKAQLVAA